MARPPQDVDGRVAQAAAAKQRSDAKRRRASEARLAELMRLETRDRFDHLDDAALVPEHRRALRRSIEQAFKPSWRIPKRLWRSGRMTRRLKRIIVRAALEPLVAAPALILAGCACLAWHNTAYRAFLNKRIDFKVVVNGQGTDVFYDAGTLRYVLLDWHGNGTIRYWQPGVGYTLTLAPPGSLSIISEAAVTAAERARQDQSGQ